MAPVSSCNDNSSGEDSSGEDCHNKNCISKDCNNKDGISDDRTLTNLQITRSKHSACEDSNNSHGNNSHGSNSHGHSNPGNCSQDTSTEEMTEQGPEAKGPAKIVAALPVRGPNMYRISFDASGVAGGGVQGRSLNKALRPQSKKRRRTVKWSFGCFSDSCEPSASAHLCERQRHEIVFEWTMAPTAQGSKCPCKLLVDDVAVHESVVAYDDVLAYMSAASPEEEADLANAKKARKLKLQIDFRLPDHVDVPLQLKVTCRALFSSKPTIEVQEPGWNAMTQRLFSLRLGRDRLAFAELPLMKDVASGHHRKPVSSLDATVRGSNTSSNSLCAVFLAEQQAARRQAARAFAQDHSTEEDHHSNKQSLLNLKNIIKPKARRSLADTKDVPKEPSKEPVPNPNSATSLSESHLPDEAQMRSCFHSVSHSEEHLNSSDSKQPAPANIHKKWGSSGGLAFDRLRPSLKKSSFSLRRVTETKSPPPDPAPEPSSKPDRPEDLQAQKMIALLAPLASPAPLAPLAPPVKDTPALEEEAKPVASNPLPLPTLPVPSEGAPSNSRPIPLVENSRMIIDNSCHGKQIKEVKTPPPPAKKKPMKKLVHAIRPGTSTYVKLNDDGKSFEEAVIEDKTLQAEHSDDKSDQPEPFTINVLEEQKKQALRADVIARLSLELARKHNRSTRTLCASESEPSSANTPACNSIQPPDDETAKFKDNKEPKDMKNTRRKSEPKEDTCTENKETHIDQDDRPSPALSRDGPSKSPSKRALTDDRSADSMDEKISDSSGANDERRLSSVRTTSRLDTNGPPSSTRRKRMPSIRSQSQQPQSSSLVIPIPPPAVPTHQSVQSAQIPRRSLSKTLSVRNLPVRPVPVRTLSGSFARQGSGNASRLEICKYYEEQAKEKERNSSRISASIADSPPRQRFFRSSTLDAEKGPPSDDRDVSPDQKHAATHDRIRRRREANREQLANMSKHTNVKPRTPKHKRRKSRSDSKDSPEFQLVETSLLSTSSRNLASKKDDKPPVARRSFVAGLEDARFSGDMRQALRRSNSMSGIPMGAHTYHGVAPSMFNANRRNSNASDGLPDNLLLVTLPKPSNPVKQERAVSATCALSNTTPAVAVAKDFRRRSSADKRNENRRLSTSLRGRPQRSGSLGGLPLGPHTYHGNTTDLSNDFLIFTSTRENRFATNPRLSFTTPPLPPVAPPKETETEESESIASLGQHKKDPIKKDKPKKNRIVSLDLLEVLPSNSENQEACLDERSGSRKDECSLGSLKDDLFFLQHSTKRGLLQSRTAMDDTSCSSSAVTPSYKYDANAAAIVARTQKTNVNFVEDEEESNDTPKMSDIQNLDSADGSQRHKSQTPQTGNSVMDDALMFLRTLHNQQALSSASLSSSSASSKEETPKSPRSRVSCSNISLTSTSSSSSATTSCDSSCDSVSSEMALSEKEEARFSPRSTSGSSGRTGQRRSLPETMISDGSRTVGSRTNKSCKAGGAHSKNCALDQALQFLSTLESVHSPKSPRSRTSVEGNISITSGAGFSSSPSSVSDPLMTSTSSSRKSPIVQT